MKLSEVISNDTLMNMMDIVRDICATAHAVRSRNDIRIRQPLACLNLVSDNVNYDFLAVMPDLVEIIKDECNVKYIKLNGTLI